ncbi:MAG TPA: hypothetical protein ENG75_02150 [Nitrospirae bacterium]|nr:hypothetical protein [Nitrospirota bacterium]HDK16730.1 hypothetical protein [Nitrospirota bacterium]
MEMMRTGKIVLLISLMSLLLVAGCANKNKLDDLADGQKEISAGITAVEKRLNAIEENQKETMKLFKPRRAAADYNRVYKIPVGSSAVKGKKDAPVTIVEFSDFQCPYCAGLQSTLQQVLKAYPDSVRLVLKDFPLSFHKYAKDAARAARAAGEQGKYWEMHDLIFENFKGLNSDIFKKFAEKLNLDLNKFMADYKSGKYDNLIQQDINLGKSLGVTGTPTLFVNGKRMQRRSFDDFKAAIEESLKKK